jgi:protein involved in polysaccharide export with SLBB domain
MSKRAALTQGIFVAFLALGVAFAAGAADQTADPSQGPATAEYRIAAGDELDIVVPLNPEFNVRTFVRPDGKISLELVDEITAEGLTTAELTEHLRNAYSTELRDPDISVNVVSMAARIYVDGHVARPGEYPWTRQVTAMQAVSLAGGLRETASGESLLVVRRGPGGEQRAFQIDLEEVASGKAEGRDLFLEPYDTVYVPSSRVADVNKWMDQYIRKNIPISPRKVVPGDAQP